MNPGHPSGTLSVLRGGFVQDKVPSLNHRRNRLIRYNAVRSHGDRDVVNLKALDCRWTPIRELTRSFSATGTAPTCGEHHGPSCIQILAQNNSIGEARSVACGNRGHATFPIIPLGLTQSRRTILDRAMVRDFDNIEIGTP